MIDEEGRTLEIERLREMVRTGILKPDTETLEETLNMDKKLSKARKEEIISKAHLVEEEKDNEFRILDSEMPFCYAKVFFHVRSCKWRTIVYGEARLPEPIRANFTHAVRDERFGVLSEEFDEANYMRAQERYEKSCESLLPAVERPRKSRVKQD